MKRVLGCTAALTTLMFACQAQTGKSEVITIDATRHKAISSYVYGVNFPDWKFIRPLIFQSGKLTTIALLLVPVFVLLNIEFVTQYSIIVVHDV